MDVIDADTRQRQDAYAIGSQALHCLCAIGQLHEVAADAATLAHQIALLDGQNIGVSELLLAGKQLNLKARQARTGLDRLTLTPLPALAHIRGEAGNSWLIIFARCDGKQVLLQGLDVASPGKPGVMGLQTFAEIWKGELILITQPCDLGRRHGQVLLQLVYFLLW